MKNNIYMLYDRVGGSYVGSMVIIVNDAVAKRTFTSFANNSNFPYKTMIDDLQLFKLGEFNLSTGEINCKVEFICNLIDLVLKEVNNGK